MTSRFESTFNTRVMPANERAFGVYVRLYRNGILSDEFTARRDDISSQTLGSLGVDTRLQMRLWHLPVSSITINSQTSEPSPLDEIWEYDGTGGSVVKKWQVFSPSDGTPAIEEEPGGYDWSVFSRLING